MISNRQMFDPDIYQIRPGRYLSKVACVKESAKEDCEEKYGNVNIEILDAFVQLLVKFIVWTNQSIV